MFLTNGDTGEELWRRNATSGAVTSIARPYVFSQSTTGSIANAEHVPFVMNAPLFLNVGSALSGTTVFTGTVRYR